MKKTLIAVMLAGAAWACAGPQQQPPVAVQQLTPAEFIQERMSRKTVLLDVRTPEEYATGHLDGAENSDFRGGAFAEEMKDWDKDKKYYLYCASGNRSGKAAEMMRQAGFKHIYNIGGYPALKEAGVPTEEGSIAP
ncbi:phage shock protein E [Pontibacter ummariensis]|uniref:Phage shock protein E n=1 Tax=Pontibacter ummariensis TaxID=1610492 RepID=A0A239KJL4_9BACT|nr:rhodanese-like domain-containing protein [Pontibacter ummariensis]PRY05706.1 phage shock protein E [Pontibacter ummariensis]SNT18245.1 phage shock protein E [Pontibacter ummariensis]